MNIEGAITNNSRLEVLSLDNRRSLLYQGLLMSATIILPVLSHHLKLPVVWILPMHWPVLMAALVYGWKGGALTGILSPVVSFILSGLPLPFILPAMTLELLTYGLLTGILKEKLRFNGWLSVGISLVLGRFVFIVVAVICRVPPAADLVRFVQISLIPGVLSALLQLIFLPLLARLWIKSEENRG